MHNTTTAPRHRSSTALIVFTALSLFVALLAANPTTVGAQNSPTLVTNMSATDISNSIHADRLVDGNTGTDDGASWLNPNPWQASNYPMVAEIDLGATYQLDSLRYFVGNLTAGQDDIRFEVSSEASGDNFQWLGRQAQGHQWNDWKTVALNNPWGRRVRVIFASQDDWFNISELEIFGTLVDGGPTTTSTTTTEAPETTTTTTTAGPTTTTTSTTTTTIPGNDSQPRSAQPGPGIVRAHRYGEWPNAHLSEACRDLHDRYWVQGPKVGISDDPNHPDNIAYPTWHPAVDIHPETGERCDYGHEHGTSPLLAPPELFELSGGWPAFGYAATKAGPPRHEDHVGHKVTVAKFRAAIGNGSGGQTLYDAGFTCDWLSKVHQGSHSMDAFSNHLHEYFLTMRCFDGLNDQGVRDGQTVGTLFSVKVMFTYGRPNRFVEENCAASRDFDVSVLTDPDGQPIMRAMRDNPIGNNGPNDRAFVCSNALVDKTLDQSSTDPFPVAYMDIWNELIKIESPDGSDAMTFQPYYMVKNSARVIEGFAPGADPSQVRRTIDLCYGPDGQKLGYTLCEDAPASNPGWKSSASPFNGALRSVHFKAVDLQNGDGPAVFCTNAYGRRVNDPLPCEPGNIEQQIASYTNHFNDGDFEYNNRSGNVAGSVWAEVVGGERTTTRSLGGGAYEPNGIGFEFIVDNRYPDDDGNGVPDGANIRGEN